MLYVSPVDPSFQPRKPSPGSPGRAEDRVDDEIELALALHVMQDYFEAPLDGDYMKRYDAAQKIASELRIKPFAVKPGLLFDHAYLTAEGNLFVDEADRALVFDISGDGHLLGVAVDTQALLLNPAFNPKDVGYMPVGSSEDVDDALAALLYVLPAKRQQVDFQMLTEWARELLFAH